MAEPMMYFTAGYNATILFEPWQTQEIAPFVFSCIAFFVLAILYEGLVALRQFLLERDRKRNFEKLKKITASNFWQKMKSRYLSLNHFLQSFLHMIQSATAFLLMLTVMTFNVWLYMSIVIGGGVGYFLFNYQTPYSKKHVGHH